MLSSFDCIPDVCIIGAGISGLLSAIELGNAGYAVHVIDRGKASMESTWASGGILSPLYPWRYPTPITTLAAYSRSLFPQLIDQLKETRIDPEYLPNGMLVTVSSERELALKWAADLQEVVVEISFEDARLLEPNVTIQEQPLWMPDIGSIRTPRLGQAMRQACLSHPLITLTEHKQVVLSGSIESPELSVDGFVTPFNQILITAGAWTSQLLKPLNISCPIKPIKGQMLLFSSTDLVSRVVLSEGGYAIPRADSRLLFGSTQEDVGFHRTPDRTAYEQLYLSAITIVPNLTNAPVELHWSGFRPGSLNGLPWIGALSSRLWINAGHYRNGVVLGPASARLVADLMIGRVPCVNPEPFQPKDLI